jgi:hypothetical protein
MSRRALGSKLALWRRSISGGSDGEEEMLEDRGGQRETHTNGHTTGDTKYWQHRQEVCWPRPGLKRKSQGRGFHAWEARVERGEEMGRMFLAATMTAVPSRFERARQVRGGAR